MRILRILLVEDDALIGAMLADVLGDMGHAVCGIEPTEAGAVRAALAQKPDLMIVDVHLRSGSGVEAVEAISRIAAIPHILMSATRIAVAESPVVVLRKPFTVPDLQQAIDRTVGEARVA